MKVILGDMHFTFPPVGHCIYCESTEPPLSTEHIVPYGLNGRLELPQASCKRCAKITGNKVELSCLRDTLYFLRAKHKFRTRRPKDRHSHFRWFITPPGGEKHEIHIPADDLPAAAWVMPWFDGLPGCLRGLGVDAFPKVTFEGFISRDDARRILDKYSNGPGTQLEIASGGIAPNLFCRLLAKIAHALAYALIGRDGFEPILQEFILSGCPTENAVYVGRDPSVPRGSATHWRPEHHACRVDLEEHSSVSGDSFVCARVRLLATIGTPSYLVVIGKSLNDKFSRLQQAGNTFTVIVPFPG